MSTNFPSHLARLVGVLIGIFLIAGSAYAAIVTGVFTTAHSNQVQLTKVVVAKPAAASGDLFLASIAINGGNSAMITAPAGWTQIARTDNDVNVSLVSYWKVVTANEANTYTWSIDGQTTAEGGITVYSGVDTENPIDAVSSNIGFSSSATTTSLVSENADAQLVTLFATDVGKVNNVGHYFSEPVNMIEKYDVGNTPFGPSMALDGMSLATAGAVSSKSSIITGNKSSNWATQAIVLRPQAESSIAFDNSIQVDYGAPTTFNYSVGIEENRALIVCQYTLNDTSVPPLYAGTPMTLIDKTTYFGGGRFGIAAYILTNPPLGTHPLELRSSSGNVAAFAASYSGVKQVGQPEVWNVMNQTNQNTILDTVTTTSQNNWLVMCEVDSGPGINHAYASSGTLRESDVQITGALADTNSGVSIGNNSFSISSNGSIPAALIADILIALSPEN